MDIKSNFIKKSFIIEAVQCHPLILKNLLNKANKVKMGLKYLSDKESYLKKLVNLAKIKKQLR